MLLINKQQKYDSAGFDPAWERTETSWEFKMEKKDFNDNDTMMERFSRIKVEQRIYTNGKIYTWFKSNKTKTFTPDTNDKQKRMVVNIINDFLKSKDKPLNKSYVDVLTPEYQQKKEIEKWLRMKLEQEQLVA